MDKLTMAHEYLLKTMRDTAFVDESDICFFVDTAWKYADAMQAESDERNKAEAEQKRKEIREMLNAPNTFVEREGQHFDDVEEWQPDWSQAPDWAEWWVMDVDSAANWLSDHPSSDPLKIKVWTAPSFGYQGNWQDSLRKRPEPKCEVDWNQAPKDATHYVIFADGLAYWHKSEKLECFDIAPSFGIVGMFVMERPHGF